MYGIYHPRLKAWAAVDVDWRYDSSHAGVMRFDSREDAAQQLQEFISLGCAEGTEQIKYLSPIYVLCRWEGGKRWA
jgi:hypothetical protein